MIQRLLRLGYGLALLFALIWLGTGIEQDPGYVLLAYQDHRLQTSIWIALLLLLLYTALLIVLCRLRWHHPWQRHRLSLRRYQRSVRTRTQGLQALFTGQWSQAQTLLSSRSAQGALDVWLNHLAAAYAAACTPNPPSAQALQALFDRARTHCPIEHLVDCVQAQALFMQPQSHLSEHLGAGIPLVSPFVAAAQLRAQHPLSDLDAQMPALLKQPWPQWLLQALTQAWLMQASGAQALTKRWQALPAPFTEQSALVLCVTRQLQHFDQAQQAEKILRQAIEAQWHSELIAQYAQIHAQPAQQLKQAEAWLPHHADSPVLLQTLGRLCLRNQLWGKAIDYLQRSLTLQPNAETHALLASHYHAVGQDALALSHYRSAAALVSP